MAEKLSQKDLELLAHFFSEMKELPNIDWQNFCAKAGQKYERNAKAAMKRVFAKITGEAPPSGGPKGSRGTPQKKTVGARKSPIKANAGMGKKSMKVKKEEPQVDSEEEHEEAIFKCEEGSGDEIAAKDDGKSTTSLHSEEEEGVGNHEEEDQEQSTPKFTAAEIVQIDDEYYANLNTMGVDDYRRMRAERGGADFVRTPSPTLSPAQQQLNEEYA